jgi:hypothetical protein
VAERIVVFVDYQNAYLTGCDVYAAGDARHRHVPHPGRLGDAIAATSFGAGGGPGASGDAGR